MQRHVLRADDGSVTLLHPETLAEYEQARAEVETSPRPNAETEPADRPALIARLAECIGRRPPVETNPADRAEDKEGAATAETPRGGCYVVTTDSQRRAWGLPDLANEAAAHDAAPGDVDTVERHDAVQVVDATEAIDLLFEDGQNESDDGDGGAMEARRSGRPDPAPVVNLKRGRGPVPDDVRAAFRELCRQPRVDSVIELVDAAIAPLETTALGELEEAHREVAALRQEEVTPERLGDARGAEGPGEAADRVARACWGMRRRLGKVGDALDRLDFSAMNIETRPSSFRRLLQRVEDDPRNSPDEGLVAACDKALREFEQLAGLAVTRIRGVADARREVAAGKWSDAAVERIRTVVGRLEETHQVLDGDTLSTGAVEAVREGLKALDDERRSADPLAATTREVLGRLEAADLPLPVLTRALDDIRMSENAGREAAGMLLERLRLVLDLPWTARADERVDIAAAMAELDAAHAGRAVLKERVRRFLATRQLTSTRWTVEGRSPGDRPRGGDGSARPALRRLVVRPARSAARAPILCLAGPPGGGKTTLAKLIARALGRPGVLVALGGVWDESVIRGLPISFRSPGAGRIVLGLRKAKVRNPVMILDEVDKVGGARTNFGDPSAALLEVLDPAQNTHFRDAYVEAPFDLSEVLFIATANDVAKIPAPLRDRLEILEAPGYTDDEKVDIVRRVLWGEQLEVNGLAGGFWTRIPAAAPGGKAEEASGAATRRRLAVEVIDGEQTVLDGEQAATAPAAAAPASRPSGPLTAGDVEVTDAAIRTVVRGHTCEGGVRHLARRLGAICQFVACRRVEAGGSAPVTVVADDAEAAMLDAARVRFSVAEILGPPRYDSLPDHVRDALSRERDRVVGLHPADPEAAAAHAWIEVMEQVPWRRSAERLDAPGRLREALDREHVGRGREKDQVLDYLVARQAAAERGAAETLCLCGPAGTGRTAFARALAAALGRRFVRVSLAGVEKPAGILGAARSAPDAGPGRLVDGLRQLGPLPGRAGDNPLVVLGELDRLGEAAAGALLGALDPGRNHRFRDRYAALPLDLAGVLFVAVAADPGRIPPQLRERLELLPLAGYTDAEKQRIAARHLIPQRLARHGLSADDLSFSPSALRLLLGDYAREPGVCALDDLIDTVCRRAARLLADGVPCIGEMGPERLARWLGAPRNRGGEIAGRARRAGVALALAATREGGDVLVVEAARLPGSGQLRVTGTVGPIATESANVALTWVRSNADRLSGVDAGFAEGADVHVHLADAARGKDGASAGVTFAVAVVSALSGQPVRGDVAMTGELTLAGRVERVAGIRQKVLAAARSGMTAVLLPAANEADVVESFGGELPCGITVHYARTMDDVLGVALPDILAASTSSTICRGS